MKRGCMIGCIGSSSCCCAVLDMALVLKTGFVIQGRGLGRMFLRHLRRTRIILHVVDAATGEHKVSRFSVPPVFCTVN